MTSSSPPNDLDRLRAEYAERGQRPATKALYSLFNPAQLFIHQQRQRATLKVLQKHDLNSLTGLRILELGCGGGNVLLEYLGYGADPNSLHGTDLLPDRVRAAHHRLAHLPLTCADGQQLPYASRQFDLVLQYMAFSSILDDKIRANLAQEMLRVLHQPGGMILWYDFWLNPQNPHTQGLRPAEIRALFPDCHFEFHKLILAPPLTRRLIRISWQLCYFLEKLRILNAYYLAAIWHSAK